ncbi:hypothetical protein HaLaN_22381 [Haematococcus lacustris]|uniref:Uncharacterized protein n=1 Tax=Haematococcus lacustris TaxID=44745 RepID=A0A6A0A3Q2_HAELA|nr:hypothetical protein HaLaN_22381 [Haematococcus lacustris]
MRCGVDPDDSDMTRLVTAFNLFLCLLALLCKLRCMCVQASFSSNARHWTCESNVRPDLTSSARCVACDPATTNQLTHCVKEGRCQMSCRLVLQAFGGREHSYSEISQCQVVSAASGVWDEPARSSGITWACCSSVIKAASCDWWDMLVTGDLVRWSLAKPAVAWQWHQPSTQQHPAMVSRPLALPPTPGSSQLSRHLPGGLPEASRRHLEHLGRCVKSVPGP